MLWDAHRRGVEHGLEGSVLLLQLQDDCLHLGHMQSHIARVLPHVGLDLLGTVRIFERVEGVMVLASSGGHCGNHGCARAAHAQWCLRAQNRSRSGGVWSRAQIVAWYDF